jgi:hypothetical protein
MAMKMGYHCHMRFPLSVRNLLLSTLLVASNAVFAAHVTAHVTSQVASCEWCVCQGQTPAGPLPVSTQVTAELQTGPVPQCRVIDVPAEPEPGGYQPRAPPPVS